MVGIPADLSAGGARAADILVDEPRDPGGVPEREVASVRWAVAAAADGTIVGVGAETESVAETVDEVRSLLAIGLPLLVVVLGIVTWRATGRTLRPVRRIRTTADGISADTLGDRVPVPDTSKAAADAMAGRRRGRVTSQKVRSLPAPNMRACSSNRPSRPAQKEPTVRATTA